MSEKILCDSDLIPQLMFNYLHNYSTSRNMVTNVKTPGGKQKYETFGHSEHALNYRQRNYTQHGASYEASRNRTALPSADTSHRR